MTALLLLVVLALGAWAASEIRALRTRLEDAERTLELLLRRVNAREGRFPPAATANAPPRADEPAPPAVSPPSPSPSPPPPVAPMPAAERWSPRAAEGSAADADQAAEAGARAALSQAPELPEARADERFSVFALVRRNPFATAGIALLLLGFAYFFQSIEWGHLVPPKLRVVLAWAGAAALDLLGLRARLRRPLWGQLAQGGAAAIAYLATYVGLVDYGMLSPPVAFAAFATISALLVFQALRADSQALAAVGLLGAYAAPALALHGDVPLLLTLSYGLLITTAALAISAWRGWLEIAVYAHVCSASLAALVYLDGRGPVPALIQQCLVNAYALQFAAWTLAWVRRFRPNGRTATVLAATLTLAAVSYVALERWLLLDAPFLAAMAATAGVLAALGLHWRAVRALAEAAFVLAALALAAGLSGAALAPELSAFVVYVEGSLLAVSAGPRAVRRWIGALLLIAGAAGYVAAAGPAWLLLLPVVVSTGFAVRAGARDALGPVHALVALAAGVTAVDRAFPDASRAVCVLLLGAATLAGVSLAVTRTAAHHGTRAYALAFALSAVLFLAAPAGAVPAWHVVGLVGLPVLLAIAVHRAYVQDALDGRWRVAGALVVALACFLPFFVGYKREADALALALLAAAALLAHVGLEASGRLREPWAVAPPGRAAFLEAASVGGLLLALAVLVPRGRAPPVHLLGGAVFATSWLAWWRHGLWPPAGARRVFATAAVAYGGAVWLLGLVGGPDGMWQRALDSRWPCVLLAAAGVANVFVSSRAGDRTGWKAAGVVCIAAVALLFSRLGSALTSPLGIAGSLLATGALFLVAGYLAPLPPPRDEAGPAAR